MSLLDGYSKHGPKFRDMNNNNFKWSLIKLFIVTSAVYTFIPFMLYRQTPAIDNNNTADASQLTETQATSDDIMDNPSVLEKRLDEQLGLLQQLETDLKDRGKLIENLYNRLELSETSMNRAKYALAANEEHNHNMEKTAPGIVKKIVRQLPPTSIYCDGTDKANRICKFHNLYFHPLKKVYFVVLTEESVIHNVPVDRSPALLEIVTIADHSVFFWDFQEVSQEKFVDQFVEVIEKRTFLFSRFHIYNIMHTLHDDIIGVYHTIRKYAPIDHSKDHPPYASFSLDHYIQYWDELPVGGYGSLFEVFSDHPIRFNHHMTDTQDIKCFSEVIVGIAKTANWYQYGFYAPQGPIENKKVNGNYVRDVAKYLEYKMGFLDQDDEGSIFVHNEVKKDTLVVFSRTENRLIVNEKELLVNLSQRYGLQGKFIRMEDLDLRSQIQILRRTKVAVGMHGSILIMAIFMKPGSVLIECYPFAVPAENYTPYKTLAGLPGMNIAYRSWVNTHRDANFPYPDRDMYHGGLKHLSEKERTKILKTETVPKHTCCMNPYWLFRIYQDTKINENEVASLIDSALDEVKEKNYEHGVYAPDIKPSPIDANSVTCSINLDSEGKFDGVLVTWDHPWNGVKHVKYGIWEHISFKLYDTDTNSIILRDRAFRNQSTISIYVSFYIDGKQSRYANKKECFLEW